MSDPAKLKVRLYFEIEITEQSTIESYAEAKIYVDDKPPCMIHYEPVITEGMNEQQLSVAILKECIDFIKKDKRFGC